MKKKVLIISEPGSGGVKRHVLELLNGIDKEKFEIYYIYSTSRADDNYEEKIQKIQKIHIYEIKSMERNLSIYKDFVSLIKIIKLIKKIKPDIIHCHSSKAGILGRLSSVFVKVKKVIYTPHAYAFQNINTNTLNKYIYISVEMIFSRLFTDKTINVSNGEMKSALKYNIDKKEKFLVIHNGLSSRMGKEIKIMGKKTVGCIARLEKQKNPIEFFCIAKKILKHDNNIFFIWIGEGSLKKRCEAYIQKNKIQSNCAILPYTSEWEEKIPLFDLFLSTSLYEGYPYAVLDAYSLNIPIVASNVVGNDEIVEHTSLYELGRYDQAVDLILESLYNHNRMIDNKNQNLSTKEMIDKIQVVYNEK